MIITDAEALLLREPRSGRGSAADGNQDALIVRVTTDEDVVGIGEVSSHPAVVKAVIEAGASHKMARGLRDLLVGQDASDIGRLWRRMYYGSLYYGRRGAAMHAISGIEIALWDIAGKVRGVPVHELLGAAKRSRVKAYASTVMPNTVEATKRLVAAQLEAGFHAVKLGWGPLGEDADLDVGLVAAAREAAGDDVDLMVDIGKAWSGIGDAVDRALRMEEYRPYWIEEPFMPEEYAECRGLAEVVAIPIAGGEEEATVLDFERLVDRSGLAVIQPDVTRAGGIGECVRIAAMAHERGRRVVPHAWGTGIIKAASLHVLAVIEEAEYLEYCVQPGELSQRIVAERFPVTEGYVDVPRAPGLGVELDGDILERCLVKDGS